MKKSNLKKNTQRNKKSVKFNLRKNRTQKYNKKEKLLKKKVQKNNGRTNKKNQKKGMKNKRRRNLRKTMKGGAIPFSELSEVYDNVKHGVNEAIGAFKVDPASAPNNPASSNVTPNVSKQFLRTGGTTADQIKAPDIKPIYDNAYSS